jgi:hypothetical protein
MIRGQLFGIELNNDILSQRRAISVPYPGEPAEALQGRDGFLIPLQNKWSETRDDS